MKQKILLIDDEDLVVKSINKLLQKEGYEVITCKSGTEALEKLKADVVDLIICDIQMPNMTGIDTVKKIREFHAGKNRKAVPEILITGYAEDGAIKEAENLKVVDYIYKPFDLRDFLGCVKKHMQK